MKKLALTILVASMLCLSPVYSFELFKKTPKAEVKSFFKQYNKALDENNTEKIKLFYDKNYRYIRKRRCP